MKEVVIKNDVLQFLDELVTVLFQKEYFGFLESAEEYVIHLYDTIYNDLPTLKHHPSPKELEQHGKYYVKIQRNKRTTWYIFFDKMGNRYLIEFITNNHSPQSAYLNLL